MAEAPARYCSNCGNELNPDDQFCRNCGTPVHQGATVPTPEADVDVPPPPAGQQQAGASQAPPQQSGGGRRGRPILMGCLGLFGLLVVVIIIGAALGGGGGGGGGGQQAADAPSDNAQQGGGGGGGQQPEANKPKPPKTYSVGQTAKVGDVEWTVNDAYLANRLTSGFGTQKRGRFVVVDFTFTNNRDEEVTLDPEFHMILKDSQGREFGTDPDAFEFVPTNLNIFLEPVNPGLSKDGRAIYQVPPDAEGFTLTLDDVEMLGDKSAVFDLANIAPKAYDSSSASASASAAAGQ